jgi:hypothetical protein
MSGDEDSGCVALLFGITLPAIAEELRAVDPKTVIDGDTFYVSVRLFFEAVHASGPKPPSHPTRPRGRAGKVIGSLRSAFLKE